MSGRWYAPPGKEYPEDTCQQCGRAIRGGMICGDGLGCRSESGIEADDGPQWAEAKVVVFVSPRGGLVQIEHVKSQAHAERVLLRWQKLRQNPWVVTEAELAELKRKEREARGPVAPAYKPRKKVDE